MESASERAYTGPGGVHASYHTHLHIVGLGHGDQQLQGLELEGVIRVLQAVNHSHLVLLSILGTHTVHTQAQRSRSRSTINDGSAVSRSPARQRQGVALWDIQSTAPQDPTMTEWLLHHRTCSQPHVSARNASSVLLPRLFYGCCFTWLALPCDCGQCRQPAVLEVVS